MAKPQKSKLAPTEINLDTNQEFSLPGPSSQKSSLPEPSNQELKIYSNIILQSTQLQCKTLLEFTFNFYQLERGILHRDKKQKNNKCQKWKEKSLHQEI